MKTEMINLDMSRIKTFVSENKVLIAGVGGLALGLTLASLMGNERARQILRSMGSTIADLSSKFANDVGGYKQLIAPLFSKSDVQGL